MASIAVPGAVPSLAELCVSTIASHLHLYECVNNLPGFISVELMRYAEKLLTYRNGSLVNEGLQTYLELLATTLLEDDPLTPSSQVSETLHSLQGLNLPWCRRLTDSAMQTVVYSCPNLTYLDISYCDNICDHGARVLADGLPVLETAILTFTKIGDKGATALVSQCAALHTLNLEMCTRMTDHGLQKIARTSKHRMINLNVGGCVKLTNISFQIAGEHMKRLRSLNLSGCASLIDFDVEDICKQCVQLENLFFRACWRLTDDTAKHLNRLGKRKSKRHLEPLRRLDLGGCSRISRAGLRGIITANRCLEELDVRGMPNAVDDDMLVELRSLHELKALVLFGMDSMRLTEQAVDRFRSEFVEKQSRGMHFVLTFRDV